MYPIPGHLAMSLAGSRLAKLPYSPAIAATFAVDILDKVFADVAVIAPYGRCWFHTLLSVAVCSCLVGKLTRRDWGFSWMTGHFLHLVGDIGFIPWFYPFVPYHWPEAPNMVALSLQGAKETFYGMHYSEAVLYVFRGKLLSIELLLFLCAAGMISQFAQKTKTAFSIAASLFFIILVFRMIYDFPIAVDVMSDLMGDWIRV